MNARLVPAAALCALALALACTRAEDKAAKARIFSPEEAIGAEAHAQDKLDANRLGEDGTLARRVLHMSRGEIAHRLGSYKARSEVSFDWQRGVPTATPDGGAPVQEGTLSEESHLTQSKGADFQVRHSNARSGGWELISTQGGLYLRAVPGPFRKRRTDRTDPERLREKAFVGLATFDRLARGLKLKLDGETKAAGRKALRYSVVGGGARLNWDDERELPPVVFPEPPAGQPGKALGADPDTARRLELFEQEQPVTVNGTITVDAETAAPLAASLDGFFRVAPARKDAPPAELTLKLALTTTDIGAELEVKEPKFEPDPSTPHAVKDPLRFLGKATTAGAASTAEAVADEEGDIPADQPEAPPAPSDEKPAGKRVPAPTAPPSPSPSPTPSPAPSPKAGPKP